MKDFRVEKEQFLTELLSIVSDFNCLIFYNKTTFEITLGCCQFVELERKWNFFSCFIGGRLSNYDVYMENIFVIAVINEFFLYFLSEYLNTLWIWMKSILSVTSRVEKYC